MTGEDLRWRLMSRPPTLTFLLLLMLTVDIALSPFVLDALR
jgi:hypothetical protein